VTLHVLNVTEKTVTDVGITHSGIHFHCKRYIWFK